MTEADWSDEALLSRGREQVLPRMVRHEPVATWIADDTGYMVRTGIWLTILVCCAALDGTVSAQAYPMRPVRLVIPFLPGGTVDFLARTVAQNLSVELKQNFISDNRTGAAGNIAHAIVAKSSPDGYPRQLSV